MIDYKLLEAMTTVVNEGGFDKAASRLNITQSAVSQRIKLLEEQTGAILLNRTVPPSVTKAGQQFMRHYTLVKRLEEDLAVSFLKGKSTIIERIAMGINADSLATWFMPTIKSFLEQTKITLDLKVDDQEETHKMLKSGTVLGCISSRKDPIQGCRAFYLGSMNYRLTATPGFMSRYFPKGIKRHLLNKIPAVIYNRKDDLLNACFSKVFPGLNAHIPSHYVPSSREFLDFIIDGHGYGMLPDLQCLDHIQSGKLTDLSPDSHISVELFWHCWNLKSEILLKLTKHLTRNAKIKIL